jgi:hypothetical protein
MIHNFEDQKYSETMFIGFLVKKYQMIHDETSHHQAEPILALRPKLWHWKRRPRNLRPGTKVKSLCWWWEIGDCDVGLGHGCHGLESFFGLDLCQTFPKAEGVLSGVFHVPLVPGEEGRVQEHEAAY